MRRATTSSIVYWFAATFVAIVVLAVSVAWSGLYNIAASKGHWAPVRAFLEFGMENSVTTWSSAIKAPQLDDPNLIRLGAAHFRRGCAPCHGAPGERPNPLSSNMLPPPPSLEHRAAAWRDRELFWIVKHGLKYTGMPAWISQRRDDEVWAVVAFLAKLPGLSPDDYLTLVRQPSRRKDGPREGLFRTQRDASDAASCASCHGDGQSAPSSNLVPRIAGQNEAYLRIALKDYSEGVRPSGIMQPVAATLSEDASEVVARHYANLKQPPHRDLRTSAALRREGSDIVHEGVPEQGIPACHACHGANASPDFPRLAGQSERFLVRQLELFRSGVRSGTPQSDVMSAIAGRMSDQQIAQTSSYFASLEPFSSNSVGRDAATAGEQSP